MDRQTEGVQRSIRAPGKRKGVTVAYLEWTKRRSRGLRYGSSPETEVFFVNECLNLDVLEEEKNSKTAKNTIIKN